jgi:tetratricopeptide (TPR) repeat protein
MHSDWQAARGSSTLGAHETGASAMTEAEALAAIRGADPALVARAEAALWQMWCHAGIPDVDRLFREGVEAIERQELEAAQGVFTRIIERAPQFAEGWNKRATIRYMAEDFAGAIADCEETLRRNPHHFGALSGQGLCHMALGQYREAAALFRRTLEVHPHLASAARNLAAAISESVKGNGRH